jgi:hypothetical protein
VPPIPAAEGGGKALLEFKRLYNEHWLIERVGY